MTTPSHSLIPPSNSLFHTILLFFALAVAFSAAGQSPSLIPLPVSALTGTGNFTLARTTTISVPSKQPEVLKVATYFTDRIRPATGYTLKVNESPANADIEFVLGETTNTQQKEAYSLDVTEKKITIRANTAAGLFYGVQTLLQLFLKNGKTVY